MKNKKQKEISTIQIDNDKQRSPELDKTSQFSVEKGKHEYQTEKDQVNDVKLFGYRGGEGYYERNGSTIYIFANKIISLPFSEKGIYKVKYILWNKKNKFLISTKKGIEKLVREDAIKIANEIKEEKDYLIHWYDTPKIESPKNEYRLTFTDLRRPWFDKN